MQHGDIGSNIRRLRLAQGHTQEQLAQAAGLSPAGFRNYEAGRVAPKVGSLIAIARVLGVGLDELVSEPRTLSCVRFRANRRLNTRDAVLTDVARWLEDFTDLEETTGDRCDWKLAHLAPEEPKAVAARAREEMGIGQTEPIRNICGLLEEYGVKVLPRPVKSEHFFGLAVGPQEGGPAVVVNTWERIPVERWIFSAAHELGHLLLHKDSFEVSVTEEDADQENEANQFASHFLMPEVLFNKEWQDTIGQPLLDRVLKVKRMLRVSYKTVLYRLHEGGHQEFWAMFYSQYRRRYGKQLERTHEPVPLGPDAFVESKASREPKRLEDVDFVEDRLSKLVRIALDDERITRDRAAEIMRLSPEDMMQRIEDWAA